MRDESKNPVSVGEIKYYYGTYRGVVVDNYDPKVKGRVKIYVPGVYPEQLALTPKNLPWAEPAESLFGGSWTNERDGDLNSETGITTIPHTSSGKLKGAQVWVFFEQGNWNLPIFFAACQGGSGWHSEHNNQHVVKTDNVRVRIDENPGSASSTCKFDSYNSNNNVLSTKKTVSQMPTRTDIEIWNEGGNAVNIIIKGNVNMKIDGDVYEEHTGDKHLTHNGNVYKKHTGSVFEEHDGHTLIEQNGDTSIKQAGDYDHIHTGDYTYDNPVGDYHFSMYDGKLDHAVSGDIEYRCGGGDVKCDYDKDFSLDIAGTSTIKVVGKNTIKQSELYLFTDEDAVVNSLSGNIILQANGFSTYNTKPQEYPNLIRGGIIFNGNYLKRSGKGDPGGVWISESDPTCYMTIDPVHGIVDNTGEQIHHNYGYEGLPEYYVGGA